MGQAWCAKHSIHVSSVLTAAQYLGILLPQFYRHGNRGWASLNNFPHVSELGLELLLLITVSSCLSVLHQGDLSMKCAAAACQQPTPNQGVNRSNFIMLRDSVGRSGIWKGHSRDGLSLSRTVWGLIRESLKAGSDPDSWGLQSSEGCLSTGWCCARHWLGPSWKTHMISPCGLCRSASPQNELLR